LTSRGWTVVRIWDFEIRRDIAAAVTRVIRVLESGSQVSVAHRG
jgi:very-short-patch-repair endonuclease